MRRTVTSVSIIVAPIVAFLVYRLVLELWCISYGLGMQLGLIK
jgi:hypothetical protein